jgi:L-arabinose isomerase
MKNLDAPEIWYIIGSQHLYGEQTLRQVAAHSRKIVEEFNDSERLPLKLVFKPHRFQAGLETLAMALPGRTAGNGFSASNSCRR